MVEGSSLKDLAPPRRVGSVLAVVPTAGSEHLAPEILRGTMRC